jgi:hypothetical protein
MQLGQQPGTERHRAGTTARSGLLQLRHQPVPRRLEHRQLGAHRHGDPEPFERFAQPQGRPHPSQLYRAEGWGSWGLAARRSVLQLPGESSHRMLADRFAEGRVPPCKSGLLALERLSSAPSSHPPHRPAPVIPHVIDRRPWRSPPPSTPHPPCLLGAPAVWTCASASTTAQVAPAKHIVRSEVGPPASAGRIRPGELSVCGGGFRSLLPCRSRTRDGPSGAARVSQ